MPGKLEFSFNSSRLGEFILDKELMAIGCKNENSIYIKNLAVSGYHAMLHTIFADSFLEDLDSANGTYFTFGHLAHYLIGRSPAQTPTFKALFE